MTCGLFSAIALLASLLPSQTWEWDETERATSYRLYYSDRANRWCDGAYHEVAPSCVAGRCQSDIPDGPANEYVQVVAVNEYGEGTGATPREVCP